MLLKVCKICNISKEEKEFPFHNKSLNTYKSRCFECHRIYSKNVSSASPEIRKVNQKKYYENNREAIMKRTSEYSKLNREVNRKATKKFRSKKYKEFIEFKRTLSCSICGNNDFRCLDFHHKDPENKENSISNIYHSTIKFKEELEKCDVLCANCHRIHHYEKSQKYKL